jgi:hypothetical protein
MKGNLPEFFGFESVGVLIYNFKSNINLINLYPKANWLFTDPENVKKEEIRRGTVVLSHKIATKDH